ncbi:MAG: hypothetical protein PVF50_07255 [Gammaproteobacteria bacterium]|jgi:hypothetical protein
MFFPEEEYRLGSTRAVLIEGPSREAIELVEIKWRHRKRFRTTE